MRSKRKGSGAYTHLQQVGRLRLMRTHQKQPREWEVNQPNCSSLLSFQQKTTERKCSNMKIEAWNRQKHSQVYFPTKQCLASFYMLISTSLYWEAYIERGREENERDKASCNSDYGSTVKMEVQFNKVKSKERASVKRVSYPLFFSCFGPQKGKTYHFFFLISMECSCKETTYAYTARSCDNKILMH